MSDNNNPDPKEQQPSPDIAQLIKALSLSGPPQQQPSHKFWSTQPVPKQEQSNTSSSEIPYGPIEPNKPLDQVRQDPYKLPNDFEWCLIDITQQDQLKEVYELLSANYVEDSDAIFRFDYSADFLKWYEILSYLISIHKTKTKFTLSKLLSGPFNHQDGKKNGIWVFV